MTRQLTIAGVATLLFLGAAFLLWGKLFAEEDEVPPSRDIAEEVLTDEDAQTPVEEPVQAILLTKVEGTVEVEGQDGQWRAISEGDELSLNDNIRTGQGSKATINVAGTILEVGESGTLRVPELRRIDLGDGQVTATVEESSEDFVVATQGSDATAASSNGEFAVISDGKGGVAVASKTGTTRFKKAGKSVEIPAGQVSQASASSAPSAPQEIPASLFLKVTGPGKTVKTKKFTLRGESSPGTIIRVNGESVKVGDDGTFQHVVALREGANNLLVDSRDAIGRSRAETMQVKVDSKGPAIDGKVTW